MSNLVKHGVSRKRMMRDASEGSMVHASMNVPREFLETSGRKKFHKFLNYAQLITFGVTVTTVMIILLVMTFPSFFPETIHQLNASMIIIPLFMVNFMGTFVASANDGINVNWFARGIGMMFVLLTVGSLLISIFS